MRKLRDDLFVFDYDIMNTKCFVIFSEHFVFVIDTFLGPDSIRDLYDFIMEFKGGREIVIIYTHWHYDHIWGSCLFGKCRVIAHERCRRLMKDSAQDVLEDFRRREPATVMGDVRIIVPDIVFSDSMEINDGDFRLRLESFPGHSEDSIIIIAEPWNICFAGDSLEDPFPLIHEVKGGAAMLASGLERLAERGFDVIYPSHGTRTDKYLITDNISYLEALTEFRSSNDSEFADYCRINNITDSFYIDSHRENIEFSK